MHADEFVRGKGRFMLTEYIPTPERTSSKYPLILTTGRILSQYNVGAQTRRTENVAWHSEDRLELHPHDAEVLGISDGDWVGVKSRVGETVMHAVISDRMQPGVVYTTFHFPHSGANVITTDNSKVSQPSEWQKQYQSFSDAQQDFLENRIPAGE
jgi:formate dehydrogenase major subunit